MICLSVMSFMCQHVNIKCHNVIAGSLESAIRSILAAHYLFKEVVGKKIRIYVN